MQSIHGEAVDAPVRQISELFLAVHNVGGASFDDFLWWAARYPVVMLPMFRVQKVLRRMSLGETFFFTALPFMIFLEGLGKGDS